MKLKNTVNLKVLSQEMEDDAKWQWRRNTNIYKVLHK